ncbi:hypothetical protein [Duganella sp. OV458]|uniref:hypothetical protein n=2 Tax=unclassified Duganella TaxID=2636909 RepID=UPI000885194D|nr:hypothetical protein [Duganella sp. OV458]SDG85145.1 hypothetical protein SAMN05216320_107291 [Duganella sp. OV458]
MTARFLRMVAGMAREIELTGIGLPTLVPANYGEGRFAWFATARGYGYPGALSPSPENLFTLWDWSASAGQYECTNTLAAVSSGGVDYSPGVMSFVDATTLLVCNAALGASATAVARSVISVGAIPSATMTHAGQGTAAYTEPGASAPANQRGIPAGNNGNLLYGLTIDAYPASNGYVQKVSSAAAARNSTALRTSLPTNNTQGQPARAIVMLGGATPNGYVVAEVTDNVDGATCRYQLVNCNSTPVAVGTQLSYAGQPATNVPNLLVPMGAMKAVAIDVGGGSTKARASLLNTNSATAPTTLLKGAEVVLPPPPGKTASDVVAMVLVPYLAGNAWFGEGKAVIITRWFLTDGTNVELPILLSSSSTSSITATVLTTDNRGKNINAVIGGVILGSKFVVSAPGGKAVVFVKRARDNQHEQFVYQL